MSNDPSEIIIVYDGSDVTDLVILASASFESQLAAQPGTFEFTVIDRERTQTFVTGKELTLTVDGQLLWGGYVTQVSRTFPFPAVDTEPLSGVDSREWVLRGVDYNILFDRLVVRNTSNYLELIPALADGTYDGEYIRTLCSTYLDVPGDFDTTTYVEDVHQITGYGWAQQGDTWRKQMDFFAALGGAIYYIDANKNLIYKSVEDAESKWGFSDVPNYRAVSPTPLSFQGATYGFREIEATEDGSAVINDALVWGGSPFTTGGGDIVFDREQNSTSESVHGRWQLGETHFGEAGYKLQSGVDARANVIVRGIPGPTAQDPSGTRGLEYPQWQMKFAWFNINVPEIAGIQDHIHPGDLVTIVLYVMEDANYPHGLIQELPARSIRITFPDKTEGGSWVRFDGMFGLQANDPFSIWRYLLSRKTTIAGIVAASADNSSTTTVYGAYGQFTLDPLPDGSTTVFNLPNGIGYIIGTQQVILDGLFQRPGYEYTPSDPPTGEITMTTAPATGSRLWMACRTTAT
jgi:hypothetical protein